MEVYMKKNDLLLQDLAAMASKGIQVNAPKLKRDMCSQFPDFNEWIREYVVNAYDAGATLCRIYGKEQGDLISIYIADDGHGMNKQRLQDFFTLYRSVKTGGPAKPVGRHGIGKMSVAAVPGQCGFKVMTCDGTEAWRAEAGCLLDDAPIRLERIEPVPKNGTTFCVQFKKDKPLTQVMAALEQVLVTYVRFLPMDIRVFIPKNPESKIPGYWSGIGSQWEIDGSTFFQSHEMTIAGHPFEVVLSLGPGQHSIYQNRVFVTAKYNLISFDLAESWQIPHLSIRVDSPAFELPFGRHCLSNEDILKPLTREIRTRLIPAFLGNVSPYFSREDARGNIGEIEEMVAALCSYDPAGRQPWTCWPVFRLVNGGRVSLNELERRIRAAGKLYLVGDDDAGADYSFFDGPVIGKSQPGCGLEALSKIFAEWLINLQQQDLVIEAPSGSAPQLTSLEKRFAQSLGFHPDVTQMDIDDDTDTGSSRSFMDDLKLHGALKELKKAQYDLEHLAWRVGHLVERDGKTHCLRRRFLANSSEIILNLYHPDVQKLVTLSDKQPALAGHWAIAMCLTEDNSILNQYSAEEREDILLVDAMAKLSQGLRRHKKNASRPVADEDRELWNFIRTAMDRNSLARK
jgi:hypothetical protein